MFQTAARLKELRSFQYIDHRPKKEIYGVSADQQVATTVKQKLAVRMRSPEEVAILEALKAARFEERNKQKFDEMLQEKE